MEQGKAATASEAVMELMYETAQALRKSKDEENRALAILTTVKDDVSKAHWERVADKFREKAHMLNGIGFMIASQHGMNWGTYSAGVK